MNKIPCASRNTEAKTLSADVCIFGQQRVVFDWLWANAAPTLNTAFSLTNVHAKWWIYYFLISSTPQLSYTTSIYDLWSFLVFSWTTAEFGWPEHSASFVSVWSGLKVSIPPLNCWFQQSRVQIILIKPLLYLNSIFSHQKAMLYQTHEIQIFLLFWKFATVASFK